MKKILKNTMIVALLACLSVVVFVSCTDFFTNSWAETAKRDYSMIKVDASNVDDLLKAARGDPEMALEILGKIKGAIDGASVADKAKLREAALRAAAQGTNVAGLIIENIGELTKNLANADDKLTDTEAQDLLNTMLSSIPDSAGRASSDLAAILPKVDSSTGKFKEDFPATEDELMQAAVIIILGEVKDASETPGDYLDTFLRKDLTDTSSFSREEQALAGIVNKLQEEKYKDGVLAGMLKPKNSP